MSDSENSNTNTEEVFAKSAPVVVSKKSTAAANAVAAKLKAAVAEAVAPSRGRSTAPKATVSSTGASTAAASKLATLEAKNTATSALRSAARSKSRGRSKSAAPKKEKTSAEKALNKAKRNAETKRKLAPLSRNLGRNATIKNQEHLELLVKLGETREAAIAKILKLNGLSTKKAAKSSAEKEANAEIARILRRKNGLGRSSARLVKEFKTRKNAGKNSANILRELKELSHSPEKEKSSTEKARDALKETIQTELEAVTPEGKEVNSAHLAQLLRLRLSGFKLTGAQYVKLKDALKNIEALEAKAVNASIPKTERSAAAKAVKEGTAIAENLVAQKERLDVCAQCELMKAFNL